MTQLLSAAAASDRTHEPAFDPAEIAGMRTAAVILGGMAALQVAAWVRGQPGAIVGAAVDAFLAVQLFRLRHSWRAWTMVRAAIGLLLGALTIVAQIASTRGTMWGLMLGLAQCLYGASLFVLLYGTPTVGRVRTGRVVFIASLAATVAAQFV